MRWPWRRRPPDDDCGEAEAAHRQALDKLEDTQARQAEVEEAAKQLRRLRLQNNFAAMIQESMLRHPPRGDRP